MCSLEKRIRDLIHFYVKENYNNYLTTNNITTILESDIPNVVEILYEQKKDLMLYFSTVLYTIRGHILCFPPTLHEYTSIR